VSKIKDIKELREFILVLENKYDLLNFEIDGVKPWALERVQIDYDLGKISGIMETPHSATSWKNKFLNIFSILYSSIFMNPFLSKKVDIIVYPHSRIKKVKDEFIDIYTFYFINRLLKKNKKFIEIESPHLGKHYKSKSSWRYHNDLILVLVNLCSRFVRLNHVDFEIINKVEKDISSKLGEYDLKSKMIWIVKRYKIQYYLYKKLFQRLKPLQIYLVVSYGGNGAMIKAAKDLGIESIELQHGNFSKFHFGYYFGEDKKELDYFPDKFYVWNEYWKNRINFPIDDKNIIIQPFDYLENRKELYTHLKKIDNQAVVLSQGVLGDSIAEKILDNWDYFKKFNIIYKLHPGEYHRYREYKNLIKLEQKFKIKIVKDIDLYELFSTSKYQIGVFSTALYEGVEFNCDTILLDLPGVEEMDKFIKIYNVKII